MTLKRRQIIGLFSNPVRQMEEGLYFSGRRGQGLFMAWHENGQLWQECTFKDGKHDGLYREWFGDGRLAMALRFHNGKRVKGLHEPRL